MKGFSRSSVLVTLLKASWCVWVVVLCLSCSLSVQAQTAQFTQNTGGSNAMTLQVPLANYPGRGVSLPITLHYSTRGLWRIGFINSVYDSYQVRQSIAETIYAEHSTAGWTTSLDIPKVEWPKQNDRYWFNGKPYALGYVNYYTYRIARVFIHMPDGSTHELRKADAVYQDNNYVDMSGTFYAVDGSRMRFDSSGETTGTLYLADGTRYILGDTAVQYIDRNGNTLNYNVANRQWTDTMGRVISMPWPANPGAGDYTYSLPGIDGSTITYTLKFRGLSEVFLPDTSGQTLKPIGDYYLPSPGGPPSDSRPTKTVSLILDTGGDALAKTMTYEYATNGYEFSTGLNRTASTESYFAAVDQTTAQSGGIASIPTGTTASRAETIYHLR